VCVREREGVGGWEWQPSFNSSSKCTHTHTNTQRARTRSTEHGNSRRSLLLTLHYYKLQKTCVHTKKEDVRDGCSLSLSLSNVAGTSSAASSWVLTRHKPSSHALSLSLSLSPSLSFETNELADPKTRLSLELVLLCCLSLMLRSGIL
jgi:hypothetical protein